MADRPDPRDGARGGGPEWDPFDPLLNEQREVRGPFDDDGDFSPFAPPPRRQYSPFDAPAASSSSSSSSPSHRRLGPYNTEGRSAHPGEVTAEMRRAQASRWPASDPYGQFDGVQMLAYPESDPYSSSSTLPADANKSSSSSYRSDDRDDDLAEKKDFGEDSLQWEEEKEGREDKVQWAEEEKEGREEPRSRGEGSEHTNPHARENLQTYFRDGAGRGGGSGSGSSKGGIRSVDYATRPAQPAERIVASGASPFHPECLPVL